MLTTIKVIGTYKVTPTTESIIQAAKYHKYDWLIDSDGKYVDKIIWENTDNLVLIEIQVSGDIPPDLPDSISHWNINGSSQAPYLEYYLDPTGKYLLSEQEAILTDNRRLCFYLHFTDTNEPLNISGTLIKLPDVSELPERLFAFTHYVPPD
jgi:hypothetical protein